MKPFMRILVAATALIIISGQAYGYHAEAGVDGMTVTLSDTGVIQLSGAEYQSKTVLWRYGEANGVQSSSPDAYTEYNKALGISITDSIQDTQGGASYFANGLTTTQNTETGVITISLGRVNAKAIGTTPNHAKARLSAMLEFDIVLPPTSESYITLTPSFGNFTFIEQTPPYADATIYTSMKIDIYSNYKWQEIEWLDDLQSSIADPIALSSYTVDLADYLSAEKFRVKATMSVEATVVPEPSTLGVFFLGLICLFQRQVACRTVIA